MKSLAVILVLVALLACEGTQVKDGNSGTVPSPKTIAETLITGDSVGPAVVGVALSALSPRIKVIRDTIEGGIEDIPERIAVLLVAGDTIRAAIDSGRIYRYSVTSPRFRTTDSVGPGTPLSRLLSDPGVYALTGEGAVFLWPPSRCGIRFQLWDPALEPEARWDVEGLGDAPDSVGIERLRQLPKSTAVGEVIVVGCRREKRTSSTAESKPAIVAPAASSTSTGVTSAGDSLTPLHFSSRQDSICGEVAENGLKVPDTGRHAVAAQFGKPDSARLQPSPNPHRPAQTDTLADVFYPGLHLKSWVVAATQPYEILLEADVSDNKYLKYPQLGIGATTSEITSALGEPHQHMGDTYGYSCALHIMSGADVSFHFANGRVRRVDYRWEAD